MFTGIVEEVGTVQTIQKRKQDIVMTIQADKILEDVQLGDSISVNGVCLTVSEFDKSLFKVDVMPETVKTTSLKELETGSRLNLERSMPANGRFGGHFVSGHVDGVGEIVKKENKANAVYYQIKVPDKLMSYFMLKGSVAIDGISLTVFGVHEHSITISLIPHTLSNTILGEKKAGDIVNIECDILAKYIANLLMKADNITRNNQLNMDFLSDHGFV